MLRSLREPGGPLLRQAITVALGKADRHCDQPVGDGVWVDELVKVLSGKLLDKPTSAASVGRHFFVWRTEKQVAAGHVVVPTGGNGDRLFVVRGRQPRFFRSHRRPRRGVGEQWRHVLPATHSVHGGSRPSVTLPRRKSSSSVGAAGVWRARAGSAAKTNRQHRRGRTAWVTSNGMNRPALLCATSSTNWPWSRRLIAALTAFTTRGQKGGSVRHVKKRRDHAFVLPHSACISDGTPVRGSTDGLCTRTNTGRITPLFYRGLGGRPWGKTNDR